MTEPIDMPEPPHGFPPNPVERSDHALVSEIANALIDGCVEELCFMGERDLDVMDKDTRLRVLRVCNAAGKPFPLIVEPPMGDEVNPTLNEIDLATLHERSAH